jgi:hypothetical protein
MTCTLARQALTYSYNSLLGVSDIETYLGSQTYINQSISIYSLRTSYNSSYPSSAHQRGIMRTAPA